MNPTLVTVIIPTKNSAQVLSACLQSIKSQTYTNIEIIVVDNGSLDKTRDIAHEYTDKVFTIGPERSAQRNYAAFHCNGAYVLFIDSDMILSPTVVESCVALVQSTTEIKGIVIPEESIGEGFWSECKKLERSFYVGVDWMEAARFFDKETFMKLGGYDEALVSGEDWDLSQRVNGVAALGRVTPYILHNEGRIELGIFLKKKYSSTRRSTEYANKTKNAKTKQTSLTERYKLFFSNTKKLFKNPTVGLGMLLMTTCEYIAEKIA